jgi:hypothetical protein
MRWCRKAFSSGDAKPNECTIIGILWDLLKNVGFPPFRGSLGLIPMSSGLFHFCERTRLDSYRNL